jgi:hypothetical protein
MKSSSTNHVDKMTRPSKVTILGIRPICTILYSEYTVGTVTQNCGTCQKYYNPENTNIFEEFIF